MNQKKIRGKKTDRRVDILLETDKGMKRGDEGEKEREKTMPCLGAAENLLLRFTPKCFLLISVSLYFAHISSTRIHLK